MLKIPLKISLILPILGHDWTIESIVKIREKFEIVCCCSPYVRSNRGSCSMIRQRKDDISPTNFLRRRRNVSKIDKSDSSYLGHVMRCVVYVLTHNLSRNRNFAHS